MSLSRLKVQRRIKKEGHNNNTIYYTICRHPAILMTQNAFTQFSTNTVVVSEVSDCLGECSRFCYEIWLTYIIS